MEGADKMPSSDSVERKLSPENKDKIAKIAADRVKRSYQRQQEYTQHQGKSVWSARARAQKQFAREYTSEDAAEIQAAFGFIPKRYYGVTQQKVNATLNWAVDLVLPQLDAMAVCVPTPDPTIDKASQERIYADLLQVMFQRAEDSGLADLGMLMTPDGKMDMRVEQFMREQAEDLKRAAKAKIVTEASQAAARMQIKMRDVSVEGGFRQAYIGMKRDQSLYGMGYMRFPIWRAVPSITYTGKKGVKRDWVIRPTFQHVSVHDFFPIDDGYNGSLTTNTGNTEITYITKAQLINCAKTPGYDKRAIADILEEYENKDRDWVWVLQESTDRNSDAPFWSLDDKIPIFIHEGYFSGSELSDYGIHGIDTLDYVSARVEVVGGRTIRCNLIKEPQGENRTYFGAPFIELGDSHFDYTGLGGMLWDTEQRVNRMLHTFEHNLDWAARPPVIYNPSAFEDPRRANTIRPGYAYGVEERFGTTGSMPDALRTMNTVTAQYHLIMTELQTILRMADEDCGIPAFAYSAQDFGRSSLGEYTQRMSNALRTIKGMAINEDLKLIEPMFNGLFEYLMIEYPELRDGQDIDLQVRGITGLLKEDLQAQKQQQVLPTLLGARAQGVPNLEKPIEYAVRQLLDQAGFPVEALGMTDPVIENALAVAATQPMQGMNPGGEQVPTLDGRSGYPAASNSASPNGVQSYNLSQTAPM